MRSICTGESYVARPLLEEKFMEVVDPEFIADWFCNIFDVSLPARVRQTHGTRSFRGSYNRETETINFTRPYTGIILHELAHHICHKQGLNGRGCHHDRNFGRVLQEMIDLWP